MRHALWILAALCAGGAAAAGEGGWTLEVVLDAKTKLGGCAAGNLLPGGGVELAAVAGNGEIWIARREEGGWKAEVAAKVPGEMIQCAIGDVRPDSPGDELVVVGMAAGTESDGDEGAAWLVHREGGEWKHERIATSSALIHGVAVADFPSTWWGWPVLLVGFSSKALLGPEPFEVEIAAMPQPPIQVWLICAELPGPGKNVIAYKGGAAVACADGSLVHLVPDAESGWKLDVLDRAAAGYARLGAHGEFLLAARDDGAAVLFGAGEPEVVHREEKELRGAVLFELGGELVAATAGYAGMVTVLRRRDDGWKAEVVHDEGAPLHHLALVSMPEGPALLTCGYSGRLLLLRPPYQHERAGTR